MKYTEEATLFACAADTLLGILAKPEHAAETGVIVIVGGPQYRVGSHRQFVHLSRAIAAAGYAVLRFDYRGMGDSDGQQRDFQAVSADIAAAIAALQKQVPSVKQVGLWGLCDGASAALLYCHETHDPRVKGLCLLNPWVRSEASLAKTQVKHYYIQRLRQKEFWRKLLNGKVAWAALTGLVRSIRLALSTSTLPSSAAQLPFQSRMALAWNAFSGPVLLLLSGDDYTAKEFIEQVGASSAWTGALLKNRLIQHTVPEADHTFSEIRFNSVVEKCTLDFLGKLVSH